MIIAPGLVDMRAFVGEQVLAIANLCVASQAAARAASPPSSASRHEPVIAIRRPRFRAAPARDTAIVKFTRWRR